MDFMSMMLGSIPSWVLPVVGSGLTFFIVFFILLIFFRAIGAFIIAFPIALIMFVASYMSFNGGFNLSALTSFISSEESESSGECGQMLREYKAELNRMNKNSQEYRNASREVDMQYKQCLAETSGKKKQLKGF